MTTNVFETFLDDFFNEPRFFLGKTYFVFVVLVILYTGCDCYRDLRMTQRKGNLKKWKIFDASLADALLKLSFDPNEPVIDYLYSGMNAVAVDPQKLGNCSV